MGNNDHPIKTNTKIQHILIVYFSAEEVVGTIPSCSNLEKEDRHNNMQIPEKVWRKEKKIKKNGVKKIPKCNLCNEYFATLSTLKLHMPLHTGKFPFVCEICKKGFSREPHLTRHMYSHTGDRPFVCQICKAAFCRNDILKKHIMSHKLSVAPLKGYKCDYCNKVFMVKYSMQLHILRHMKIKMVECEFCKKKFLKKSCLQRHLYTHTGVKPFVCGKCNIGFVRKNDYESHIVTHFGEKRYNCDSCSRGYARKTELMKHILSHTGNVMKCDVCDFVFHSCKDYQQHKHVHVSIDIIGKLVEGGEPFTCDICMRSFQTRHLFLNHISYYRKRHARISRKMHKDAKK